jgi:hypothetical protein
MRRRRTNRKRGQWVRTPTYNRDMMRLHRIRRWVTENRPTVTEWCPIEGAYRKRLVSTPRVVLTHPVDLIQ